MDLYFQALCFSKDFLTHTEQDDLFIYKIYLFIRLGVSKNDWNEPSKFAGIKGKAFERNKGKDLSE